MGEKRQLILFILVFLALIGAMGTLTYFKFSKYKECQEEISSLEGERDYAQRLIDEIPALRKQAKALSDQLEVYAEILPKEHEVQHDAFVETMDRFARETGLQILRADPYERKKSAAAVKPKRPGQPETPDAPPPFNEHSYLFELVGTFPSFLRFVNKIENWDRFLSVEEMDIRPQGMPKTGSSGKGTEKEIEAAQEPVKAIQLVVTTYTYTPKSRAASADEEL